MPDYNYILGGVKAKKATTAPKPKTAKKASTIKKPSKAKTAPKIPKAPKVIDASIHGTVFIPSKFKFPSFKKSVPIPNLSKKYRGANEDKLKLYANSRGQKIPKVVKDKQQCFHALGNIECNGHNYCYICLSKLIPHADVYKKCKTNGLIEEWNIASLPDFVDSMNFYPQCEHIIACKTVSDDLNPWYMNFMMYSIHVKLFKLLSIVSEPSIPAYAATYTRPIPSLPSTDVSYLEYFLKIIIRMNYEWSHAICNNIKTNHEFAIFSGSYSIDTPKIVYVLNLLFEEGKNYYQCV